ncbi:hypothetical protein Hanom_Chr06g00558121 [Helianthus anomalus]
MGVISMENHWNLPSFFLFINLLFHELSLQARYKIIPTFTDFFYKHDIKLYIFP